MHDMSINFPTEDALEREPLWAGDKTVQGGSNGPRSVKPSQSPEAGMVLV